MTNKRLRRNQNEERPDESNPQRRRLSRSFSSLVQDSMSGNVFQKLTAILEVILPPMISEAVELAFQRRLKYLQRYPSDKRIQQVSSSSSLKLIFEEKLNPPIYTYSRIEDQKGNNLKLILIDFSGNGRVIPSSLKIEIVMMDGDFASDGKETWTKEEFDNNVVKERTGHRPLLNGETTITLRGGIASINQLSITDNSSWVRSRNFRIGARVVDGSSSLDGLRIQEAITERFTVRDQRGEQYKKSYPPSLDDEVWRLERIGKGGAFHKRLSFKGINTVQDFLKLLAVNEHELKNILGQGMSAKKWEVTVDHARTCKIGEKLYTYRAQDGCSAVVVNAICEAQSFFIDGSHHAPSDVPFHQRALANQLVPEAYAHWNHLEVYNRGSFNQPMPQLTGTDVNEEYVTPTNPDQFVGFMNTGAFVMENFDEINYLPMKQSCASFDAPLQVNFPYASDDEASSLWTPLAQPFGTGDGRTYT